MYPSTEMLISVQKYKLQYGKISPILSTQITAPVKKKKSVSQYSKIHVYNNTTIFIPVQKYKCQNKNKSCGTKNLKKNGKKNITTVQQCVSQ